jgi:hypothetical protein
VLVCPLMMMFMMGGMHGGHGAAGQDRETGGSASERHDHERRDHEPTPGRR